MEEVISVKNLTRDYGKGRGVFDVSFDVKRGEVFGFVGTNGSGKTTILRHIMGFLKAQTGEVKVLNLDAWKDSRDLKKYIEYIPGEIAFPDLKDGTTFLKNQAELLGIHDLSYAKDLIKRLQLDPSANLKRMSKGMKQKTAIVAGLMADKEILILDEPTNGLDPLMRETFLEIILEEKRKGKTIIMSSQMFDELELTCDKVALILNGKIVDIADVNEIKNSKYKTLKIEFINEKDYKDFKKLRYKIVRDQPQYNQVTVKVADKNVNKLFSQIKQCPLKFINETKQTLERYFQEQLFKAKTQSIKDIKYRKKEKRHVK